jgi:GH24 family phage-related lysozyme (muramidase)
MNQRSFTEAEEGKRYKVYKCSAENNTIGIGWNIDANPLPQDIAKYLKEHGKILDEHIDRLWDISINRAINDCNRLFPNYDLFSPNREIALTDFVFQVGLTVARQFVNTIKAINEGKWQSAADRMLKSAWAKQCPNRAKRVTDLIRRG